MPRPTDRPNEHSAPLPQSHSPREALREQIDLPQSGQPIPAEQELCLARDVNRRWVRKALNPAHVEIAVVAAN